MRIDDFISSDEIRLIDKLKGKNRMEQDQIIFDYEGVVDDGLVR